MTRRAPRQADIAALAGVSQATVSVVLGGNQGGVRMSEDTRLRVLAAAEKLGYVPDPVATRLASRRNHMLGLYTFKATFPTDVADSYYPILVGVEEQAAALGQDLILFTGADGRGERTHDEAAIRRTKIADGCLFFGRHVPVASIEKLVETGFPLVYIGRRDELEGRIPFVGADYVSASAAVVDRLVSLGHRNVRYVRENDDAPSSTDRERGVVEAAARAGVECRVVRDEAPVDEWRRDGVTAVVVEETDTHAAYRAVRAAVDGTDLSFAVLGRPPEGGTDVTGFEVPRREMGRRAVELLVELITGDPGDLHQLLPCTPVPGTTVKDVR
ncbi:LacI family DNA-binding transcriptional regulator [Umezawaea tangerina]|uniref:DNA-binding LacI/PurR family transcriptional regulator n=1 Tax=Umezawaea tangerina TaxID=84725 RepID=A0A2T0SN53_9PSEU|nr:LacI family DNA-binding transcriptional regulator [Umezawaea tangerina]PRY34849.1 DNA-binding LacI/PurR family transcriptional regulator [Umezawaea tangerina]